MNLFEVYVLIVECQTASHYLMAKCLVQSKYCFLYGF